jgi:hypothetical protein
LRVSNDNRKLKYQCPIPRDEFTGIGEYHGQNNDNDKVLRPL